MSETTQPQVDTALPQAETVDAQPTKTETTPFLTVKYNKEEIALDADKAREYAQKGMNYDKLHQQYEALQAKGAEFESYEEFLSLGREIAQEQGVSLGDVAKQMRERKAAQRDELIAEQEGIPVEVARKLRIERERAEKLEREKNELSQKTKTYEDKEAVQARYNEELDAFVEKYGKMEIPKNVTDEWASGVPLIKAYELFKAQERIAELESTQNQTAQVQKVNEENAAASSGSLGTPAGHEKEYTVEDVKKMSASEIKKVFPKIRHLFFS